MKKMFISYSHGDIDAVKEFALHLSIGEFDLWIDEKNISVGNNYTTKIFSAIHDSDYYVIFISKNSVNSLWVNAELDFALREKIERNKLVIIPVRIDDTEMPVILGGIDYSDARFSVGAAAKEVVEKYGMHSKVQSSKSAFEIASVGFEVSEETDVQIGPFVEGLTAKDLEESKRQLLTQIRKKAAGILMNFVSVSDFDFLSDIPRFKNGFYEEKTHKKSGDTAGSICERVRVEATVFNPDENRVYRLMNDRLEVLNVNAMSFGVSVRLQDGEQVIDVGRRCLQKIQEQYTILEYDNIEGAKVELSDDFYLSLLVTEDIIKIKLSTKYDFQFAGKMKGFSLSAFMTELLS